MDEGDKKQVAGICWKTIFIAVVLVAIGIIIGRATVGMCPLSKMGSCGGGYGMRARCDKGGGAGKCDWADKSCKGKKLCDKQLQSECKKDVGMCKPGCACPKCLKKAECMADPNKAGCPMKGENIIEPEKE